MFATLPITLRGWRPAVLAGLLGLSAPLAASAQNGLWTNDAELPAATRKVTSQLTAYRAIDVNLPAMRAALLPAPAEQLARTSPLVLAFPTPEGGTARFRISQVTVMHPALAAKYPEIKTYQGQGIEDPSAVARIDVSPAGLHVMVIGLGGRYYIDPAQRFGNSVDHLVFRRSAIKTQKFVCEQDPLSVATPTTASPVLPTTLAQRQANGTQLKTYRLALANSYEYAAAVGGTQTAVAAAKVTSMNRINGVYERELAVRMVLVANNNLLDFVRNVLAPNPVYTDASGPAMLPQNQTNVDRIIGNGNYDIGHVFSTGGGGIAQRPSVCVATQNTPQGPRGKACGVTGSNPPVADAFDIDFVAHEMGHQFNCNHTFNNNVYGSCSGGNRASGTAYEPGSGVTIMAYAGLCSPEDLAQNSIDIFHSASFDEVLAHINNAGNCGVVTNTGNFPPVPNAGANYTIPKSTPFALTGSATDANNDPMTYEWEEFDRANNSTAINSPSGDQPIFRPFLPTTSPTRYFPRLDDLLNNTQSIGEMLPSYARSMRFRFVARDNRVGGGGVNYAANLITVDDNSGPFVVQFPNTNNIIWQAGAPAQVNWDVANTAAAPVSAANVDILLSTDGGFTYPVVLLANTPNDGIQSIAVPMTTPGTTQARVMVRATGNVFFDISNQNFTVEASNGPTFYLSSNTTSAPLSACVSASASTSVSIGQILGFTGPVTLGAANLPAGISVSYAPATVNAGGTTTATISAATTTTPGTYLLTLTGTSAGVTHSQAVSFTVLPGATQAAIGISPANPVRAIQRPRFSWNAVPDATSYELQVATANTFAAGTIVISQTLTGTSFTPTAQLAANTTYFWRVRGLNGCTTAPYSAVLTFQTGTQTCVTTAATQVPRPIMAGATATSVINIADASRVGEVRVRNLNITHTATAELEVTLTSPNGTAVVLIARNTCPGTAGFNVNLDDLASAALTCPANSGATVRPANPLVALTGGTANGNWTLRVNDNGTGTGTLNSWSLEICTLGAAPDAPGTLSAFFNGFVAGQGGNNELLWTAATTGAPVMYYELQRSFTNNQNFLPVAGGSNIPASAGNIFEDFVQASGRYYYRVRACNSFGCSEWTNEADVLGNRATAQQVGVQVVPNPSTGIFQLSIDNTQHGAVALRVTDALGRTVAAEQLTKGSATLQHTLDLSRLAPGVYNLHLALPNGTVVQKLLKQ